MANERVERRLAAILAADVAGYSRLMGRDEEGTLAALKACRPRIDRPKASPNTAAASVKTDRRRRAGRICQRGRCSALRHGSPARHDRAQRGIFPKIAGSSSASASMSATSSSTRAISTAMASTSPPASETLAVPGADLSFRATPTSRSRASSRSTSATWESSSLKNIVAACAHLFRPA